ncbi:hypothetical protein [Aurantibacillus circumpalustris]|uniref:hypothetical protein n=1 Tax=Aurantibacillus circumpalustris TaxID=3036359 RepID=UPI00295BE249|nr:hypothetical protein [Aurantibacillus circumpalustris]
MVIRKISFSLILFLLLSFTIGAQNTSKKYSTRKLKKEPHWIEMMDDPRANYYETVRAFRLYWKDKVLPKEPFENEEMDSFEREVGLIDDKESEREREREERRRAKQNKKGIDYSAEVRAFKGWMQSVKPWIKQNGYIMTEQERQAIVDKQQAELKELEIKNGKK